MKKFISGLLILTLVFSLWSTVPAEAKKAPKLSKKKVSLFVGKSVKLKVKNNKKKVKWSSKKKKVATVTKKGKVTAKKKGTASIIAKIGKKKLKCKVTVKENKTADNRKATLVENFQRYQNGYNWSVYTLGEGLTSGGSEKPHVLAPGETMKVVTDPENPSNKLLQVKPKFYSFAPVLTVDLAKLTGVSAKKLGDYSGVRAKLRVVSDSSAHLGITFAAFFGKPGTINKKYAFMTYTKPENALPAEREFYKYFNTKAMAAGQGINHTRMPQFDGTKHTKGHKFSDRDPAAGFSTQTLNFTRYLTNDLKSLSSFDIVLGGSYGTPTSGSLTWYIDDIQLLS